MKYLIIVIILILYFYNYIFLINENFFQSIRILNDKNNLLNVNKTNIHDNILLKDIDYNNYLLYDNINNINLNNPLYINLYEDKVINKFKIIFNNILIIINKDITPLKFNTSLRPIVTKEINDINKLTPYLKYMNYVFKNNDIYIRGINNIIENKTDNQINYNFDILIDYKMYSNNNPLEVIMDNIILNCNIIIEKLYNDEDIFFSRDNNNKINIFVSNIYIKGINKKKLL